MALELGRGPDSVAPRRMLDEAFGGLVATRRERGEVRRQVTQHEATFAKLRALQSLTFKGVGPAGPNIYLATFENGSLEWRIWLNLDGSVDVFRYRDGSPPK